MASDLPMEYASINPSSASASAPGNSVSVSVSDTGGRPTASSTASSPVGITPTSPNGASRSHHHHTAVADPATAISGPGASRDHARIPSTTASDAAPSTAAAQCASYNRGSVP